MRSSVITSETSPAHFIENYRFKVLGSNERAQESAPVVMEDSGYNEELGEQSLEQGGENFAPQSQPVHQMQPSMQSHFGSQPQPAHQPGFDSSFVEELLKKTDELSSNIIKLQMQIENQESEFAKRLETEIARAKMKASLKQMPQTRQR